MDLKRQDRLAELTELALPLLIAAVVAWWTIHAKGYWFVDDAFISFRYVKNLAAGQGLTWNPGTPVEGYTNLLWVLLLTPLSWLGLDLVRPAALLGALFQLGTVDLLRRICRQCWPHRSPWLRMLAPCLLATQLQCAFWAVSGMETPMFGFWVLLAAHLAIRCRGDRTPWLLGAACAAACLTRPEGLMVSGLIFISELTLAWRRAPVDQRWSAPVRRARALLPAALLVGGVVGIHLTFRLIYYGYPLPNTFYAKVALGEVALQRGVVHLWGFFTEAGGLYTLPGLALLLLGWKARPVTGASSSDGGGSVDLPEASSAEPAVQDYLLHGFLLWAVYLLYLFLIGGDLPGWYRFYLPLLPLPLIGLTALLLRAGDAIKPGRGDTIKPGLRAGALALGFFAVLGGQQLITAPSALDNIKIVRGLRDLSFGIAAMLKNQVPESALLAIDAVGVFGYYMPNRIIDFWGLNDPVIAHREIPPNARSRFAHDKFDLYYTLSLQPDFIIIFLPIEALKGYDLCWQSQVLPRMRLLRRNTPLQESQRGLGMPPGEQRTLRLPPPCDAPLKHPPTPELF